MAILSNRIRTTNHIIELSKLISGSVKKSLVGILVIATCYLMYFPYPGVVSRSLLEAVGATLSACNLVYSEGINLTKSTYDKFLYFKNLEIENLKLKLEIELLKKNEQSKLILQAENAALKKMLNVSQNISSAFITAKVIGVSFNPFSSVATIEVGSKAGINVNDIVRGKKGLVGRVIEVSDHYAKVMLITDQDSRIPVFSANSQARGILAKQDGSLKIIYLNEDHDLQPGDLICTSGEGTIFVRGIPVAVVTDVINGSVYVQAIEDFNNLDFLFVNVAAEV